MKIKKIAVLTASTIAAIAAAIGTVYGVCWLNWEVAVEEFERINWHTSDFSNLVWKYETFHNYLYKVPIHYFAVLLLIGVYFLFLNVIIYHFIDLRIKKWKKLIKEEEIIKKECIKDSEEILGEIQNLNLYLDHISPCDPLYHSNLTVLTRKRLKRLSNSVIEIEIQISCINSLIESYRTKIRNLEEWL